MSELQLIQKQLREIKSMVSHTSKVRSWVNGQTLTQLTIWNDSSKLRTARENGYVEYKSEVGKGMLYNLDSIHNMFFKPKS